jgi:hypothetical protein
VPSTATQALQLNVFVVEGQHKYVITSARVMGDVILINGSVDGISCSVTLAASLLTQTFDKGGVAAIQNLVAPFMLAAVPWQVPTGSFVR